MYTLSSYSLMKKSSLSFHFRNVPEYYQHVAQYEMLFITTLWVANRKLPAENKLKKRLDQRQ